jgi:hypothetical protein
VHAPVKPLGQPGHLLADALFDGEHHLRVAVCAVHLGQLSDAASQRDHGRYALQVRGLFIWQRREQCIVRQNMKKREVLRTR